jgi:hypothetical protein
MVIVTTASVLQQTGTSNCNIGFFRKSRLHNWFLRWHNSRQRLSSKQYIRVYDLTCKSNQLVLWPQKILANFDFYLINSFWASTGSNKRFSFWNAYGSYNLPCATALARDYAICTMSTRPGANGLLEPDEAFLIVNVFWLTVDTDIS